jgi:hypothetical protein
MNATKTAAKYHAEYRSFGLDERADAIITVDDRGVVRVMSEIPKWCSKDDNAHVYAGIRERFAEFEDDLLSRFFPDVDLEIGLIEKAGEPHDMEAAEKKVTRVAPGDETNTHMTGVLCPNCMERFEVRTRTLPGLTFEDMERLTEGAPDGEVE